MTTLFAFFDPSLSWENVLRFFVVLMFAMMVLVPACLVMAFVVYLIRQRRFSLRDLFWMTLVVGCLLGWWHDRDALYWQQHYHKQAATQTNERSKTILEAMRDAGYDAKLDGEGNFKGLSRRPPDPLADILGKSQ